MVKFPGLGTQTSCSLFAALADAPQSTRKLHFQGWVFAKRRGAGVLKLLDLELQLRIRKHVLGLNELQLLRVCLISVVQQVVH